MRPFARLAQWRWRSHGSQDLLAAAVFRNERL